MISKLFSDARPSSQAHAVDGCYKAQNDNKISIWKASVLPKHLVKARQKHIKVNNNG